MTRIPIFIIILSVFLCGFPLAEAAAAGTQREEISLISMSKEESLSRTKIILNLSALPEFEPVHSGQRVDLTLPGVKVSPQMSKLPEDETVVKIMLGQKRSELLVSFLLRRPPMQMVTKSQRDPARIELNLYWEKDRGSRPAIAFRIDGMPSRKGGVENSEKLAGSPWKGRWLEFFAEYRTPWQLKPNMRFSMPGLPELPLGEVSETLKLLQSLVAENKWKTLLKKVTQPEAYAPGETQVRDLWIAEGLLRTGSQDAAEMQLRRLSLEESPYQERVDYLTAFSEAAANRPLEALLTVQGLLKRLAPDNPLLPAALLLVAECEIAVGQDQAALNHLGQAGFSWPDPLKVTAGLRRTDALAGTGELKKALGIYEQFLDIPGLLDQYPFSTNRIAATAFATGQYALAMSMYRKLSDQLEDLPGFDLALFAAAEAAYSGGDENWGMIDLQKVQIEMEGTEGGDRGALRLLDHMVLSGNDRDLAQAVHEYRQLAGSSKILLLREEAAFKTALGQYLLSDHAESVAALMTFRREFASGQLIREADALLLEQLPGVVQKLLADGEDLKAVVLVEQNRKLLLQGGVDQQFLDQLATAFARLGLYRRASRVLLYLFDQAPDEQARERYFQPLAQYYLNREEYQAATSYAQTYLERYPKGKRRGAMFGILLDAMDRQGMGEELLAELQRKDRPSSPSLEVRAAKIYWQQQKLSEAIKSFEKAERLGGKLSVKEMALLAEAYYQTGANSKALKTYKNLQSEESLRGQALFRSGQLLLRQGKRADGLKLLEMMVDENSSSSWLQLAQDLLIEVKQ